MNPTAYCHYRKLGFTLQCFFLSGIPEPAALRVDQAAISITAARPVGYAANAAALSPANFPNTEPDINPVPPG